MTPEDETALAELEQENDDLASGFSDEPAKKPANRQPGSEPAAPSEASVVVEEKPEYAQVTAKELAELRAAAAKTASYDQQFSKAFGTIGNLQKLLNEQKAAAQPAPGRKIEIPKEAWEKMKDFPELAKTLEDVLSGAKITGDASEIDSGLLKKLTTDLLIERAVEDLDDRHPDWRKTIGAVTPEKPDPDPDHPFRKWLSTKDAAYQHKINTTFESGVISRAIRLFQKETVKPASAAEKPRDTARADRIRNAVQQKGDVSASPSGKTEDEEFEEGFKSR